MENYPFDTCGLTSAVIDDYNETYKALKAKFQVQLTGNINFQLDQFEVFRQYLDSGIIGSYAVKQGNNHDSYVLFVQTHSRIRNAVSSAGNVVPVDNYEYQTWAIAYLKKDFGRVLIRRETLADKIIELLHPVELDFDEDKPFSDTFYVLVNDRDKANLAMNRNFRNAVMDIRRHDFVIEIFEHTLIVGNPDPISPERAIYLAEFVGRVSALC